VTPFRALADTLGQLADAIRPLGAREYTSRTLRSSGSIGAHVRHCLDHVSALERGIVAGEVCYDTRERDTIVERDPRLGDSRLRRASARLAGYDNALIDRPLRLVAQVTADGTSVQVPTTVGRELAFVISHTIHHCALVAVLLEQAKRDIPTRFGLAPTTPDLACAR
jgi:uncharacterized damage-inducible protein DinB